MEMKTSITVNEDHSENGVEWSVSFDGYNTGDKSQTVIVANKDEAFKLRDLMAKYYPPVGVLSDVQKAAIWFDKNSSEHRMSFIVGWNAKEKSLTK